MNRTRQHSTVLVLCLSVGLVMSSCHDGDPFPPLEGFASFTGGMGGSTDPEPGNTTGGSPTVDPEDPTDPRTDGGSPGVATTVGDGGDGGDDGNNPMGGYGGIPTEVIPRPPGLLSVGRLPNPAAACWLRQPGETDPVQWQQRRSLYQSVFNEWAADTALVINWEDECGPVLPDTTHEEDLRILLEDRPNDARPSEIDGCSESHHAATWAITPDENDAFSRCAWNMSLSSFLPTKSTVLHAAGHALGIVHDHFGSIDVCPLDLPEERSFSPYLSEFDVDSALLFGMSYDESLDPELVCGLPQSWGDAELSQGDRLTISMLYPPALEHELHPIGPAMRFNGSWVFREEAVIAFEYDWLRAGASPDWFLEPRWQLEGEGTGLTVGSSGLLGEYTMAPEQQGTATHSFVDPFGEEHWASEEVQMSNTKHTAVLSTIL